MTAVTLRKASRYAGAAVLSATQDRSPSAEHSPPEHPKDPLLSQDRLLPAERLLQERSLLPIERLLPGASLLALERVDEVALCGGKAVNLGRLMRAGLPVPSGVVITVHALNDFLRVTGIEREIELLEMQAGADFDGPRALEQSVQALFSQTPLPDETRALLAQVRAALGARGPFAVRSSAVGEDAGEASYAGLLDSVLDVDPAAELEAALKRVWASRWSARAAVYAHTHGKRLGGIAVIVQRQVDARYAGVLFTRSPERDSAHEMLCEYCTGLAQRLVDGAIVPARPRADPGGGDRRARGLYRRRTRGRRPHLDRARRRRLPPRHRAERAADRRHRCRRPLPLRRARGWRAPPERRRPRAARPCHARHRPGGRDPHGHADHGPGRDRARSRRRGWPPGRRRPRHLRRARRRRRNRELPRQRSRRRRDGELPWQRCRQRRGDRERPQQHRRRRRRRRCVR